MQLHLASFLAVSVLSCPTGQLLAQRMDVTLAPVADATLYQDALGALSNGAGTGLFLGNNTGSLVRRTVVAFDVQSVVPPGSRIVHAQLQLTVSQTTATVPIDVGVHRLTQTWGEGATLAVGSGGGGGPAQAGDATWLHSASPTPWTTAGGDFDATASGRGPMPIAGALVVGPSAGLVADVQNWLDGRATNAGWLLKTDGLAASTARRLHSRESTVAALRPQLLIGYVAAGSTWSVGTGCVGSNNASLVQALSGPLIGGTQVSISIQQGLPHAFAATMASFGISLSPIELDPGCTIHIEPLAWPSLGPRFLDGSGQWADTYSIPVEPGLFGIPIALQSFALDNNVARGFVLSNAHLAVVR